MPMVRTRAEVKIKLGQWIEEQKEFTTQQAREHLQPQATNILLSPNRLTNYIRATRKAVYDGNVWKVRLKPFKSLKTNATERQAGIQRVHEIKDEAVSR